MTVINKNDLRRSYWKVLNTKMQNVIHVKEESNDQKSIDKKINSDNIEYKYMHHHKRKLSQNLESRFKNQERGSVPLEYVKQDNTWVIFENPLEAY